MELVTPGIGMVFWTTLSFLIVLFLLRKMAWKPVLSALKEREDSIEEALQSAEKARQEMARLQASNEDLLKEARNERDALLKEAREAREKLIAKAETDAREKADDLLAKAREEIRNEKNAALAEMKNQVATLSIEIAEKVIRQKLSADDDQKQLVDGLVDEINLN